MIKKAILHGPDNGAYIDSLGWVYYKKGMYQEALEYLKRADETFKDPVIYDHIGDVHYKLNQIDDAIKYWNLSLELLPDQEKIIQKINEIKSIQASR